MKNGEVVLSNSYVLGPFYVLSPLIFLGLLQVVYFPILQLRGNNVKLRGLVSDVIARKWQVTVGIQIPCSSLPCCVPPQQEGQFTQKILIPLFGFVNYLCFYFLKLGAVVEINLWDLQYACKFLFMPLFREADYLLLKMMH